MTEGWKNIPVFGARPQLAPCTVRPSAYGLIEDEKGRLAIVRTAVGVFLPGGGMESNETVPAAVARETIEECGLIVTVGGWSIRAIQFVYSESERTHFEKRSTFVEARIQSVLPAGTEPDHELVWMASDRAARALSLPSDGWAVEQWRRRDRMR